MWQHHYVIHAMRMDALRAEAERERRWRLASEENGRPVGASGPNGARVAAARLAAAISRSAGRMARRLDARVAGELGPDLLLRDL